MSKQLISTSLAQSIRQQSPQRFNLQQQQQQRNYQPILPNARSSNSANYIPAKVYESYREQNSSSQISKSSQHTNNPLNSQQLGAYEKLSQLTQRLKNIHHFYKLRIEQQRNKNSQRNQVFMSIVQQLQRSHSEKIAQIKSSITLAQQQKHQVGYVDDKMSQIKLSIDQILKQSASFKSSNQRLQKQIMLKQQTIREKEKHLQKVIKEEKQFRDQLEQFMKMNMKQNRKQRQMLQMIDNVVGNRGR